MTAADVRAGGRWGYAQATKNALLYGLVRAALAVAACVPPSLLHRLGRGLGALAHAILPDTRRLALANVRRALPQWDEARRRGLVRAAYGNLGGHLGDAVASLRGKTATVLPFPEAERQVLAEALREGRGVLFVSAHLGPWERVAQTLVASGFPLTTVARESYDPRLTALYDRLRGSKGVASIYRGAPGAPVRMLRTLRSGGLLGMPMDLRSRVPSIDVPFLGTPAATPVGPARMACRTGAVIVVGTAAPFTGAASDPSNASGGLQLTVTRLTIDDPASEAAVTARINDELSQRILAMPEQWVWMHPRWSEDE
ncbi:lysophospholipid acyltransferase family protein [Pendulispora rubella]|uniref:Lysophospholipid acyltransferase family protein n=1 Tax=Pendulispora rubella TaxID=2741070 RepID=A0ABZ2LG21_9BACT